jgi:hypothetical protein
MNPKYKFLITTLSWEERFLLGFDEILKSYDFETVLLLNHAEKKEEKRHALDSLVDKCKNLNLELKDLELSSNPIQQWNYLKNYFTAKDIFNKTKILLDISTMRRETIWALLSFLRLNENAIEYIYSRPKDYNKEWLSREPDTPRLLFKHSGIAEFGKATALLILTGFDADRTRQIVNYYEPELTIIATQIGEQYQNDERNSPEYHIKEIKGLTKIQTFEIDTYLDDHGYSIIKETLQKVFENYNIIVSSQGPKLSAISLYRIHAEFPEIALSYVPCRQYNTDYSHGLRDQIVGRIDF